MRRRDIHRKLSVRLVPVRRSVIVRRPAPRAIGDGHSGDGDLPGPTKIGGRQFASDFPIVLDRVLPERQSVPMTSLVGHLRFIKRTEIWGQYLRTAVVTLPLEDVAVMSQAVRAWARG